MPFRMEDGAVSFSCEHSMYFINTFVSQFTYFPNTSYLFGCFLFTSSMNSSCVFLFTGALTTLSPSLILRQNAVEPSCLSPGHLSGDRPLGYRLPSDYYS